MQRSHIEGSMKTIKVIETMNTTRLRSARVDAELDTSGIRTLGPLFAA
jgi:hypothetical protein